MVLFNTVYHNIKKLLKKMQQEQQSRSLLQRLPAIWQSITHQYKLLKIQGQGSFGQVVKATDKGKN